VSGSMFRVRVECRHQEMGEKGRLSRDSRWWQSYDVFADDSKAAAAHASYQAREQWPQATSVLINNVKEGL